MKKRIIVSGLLCIIVVVSFLVFMIQRSVNNKNNYAQEEKLLNIGFSNLYYSNSENLNVTNVEVYRVKNDSYILIEYNNINSNGKYIEGFLKILEKEGIQYYKSQSKLSEYEGYEKAFENACTKFTYSRVLTKSEILTYIKINRKN
ncbi:hypothetical protein [Haploplasma axanthum]|nr:hypothetical protein [Haploplasma axanthum]